MSNKNYETPDWRATYANPNWRDTYIVPNTNNITEPTGVATTSEGCLPAVSFGSVLNSLIYDGLRASRSSWRSCEYISVRVPDEYHRVGCPYIYVIRTRLGKPIPWLPSFEDIFAKDWVVFK